MSGSASSVLLLLLLCMFRPPLSLDAGPDDPMLWWWPRQPPNHVLLRRPSVPVPVPPVLPARLPRRRPANADERRDDDVDDADAIVVRAARRAPRCPSSFFPRRTRRIAPRARRPTFVRSLVVAPLARRRRARGLSPLCRVRTSPVLRRHARRAEALTGGGARACASVSGGTASMAALFVVVAAAKRASTQLPRLGLK